MWWRRQMSAVFSCWLRPVLWRKKVSRERGHPTPHLPSRVKFNEQLYVSKGDPFARAKSSQELTTAQANAPIGVVRQRRKIWLVWVTLVQRTSFLHLKEALEGWSLSSLGRNRAKMPACRSYYLGK